MANQKKGLAIYYAICILAIISYHTSSYLLA